MGSTGVGGSLSAASDVTLNSPSSGQSLRRSGAYWVNETIPKADVGLGNVDNTSDANKPVSTAQAAAIATAASWSGISGKPPVIAAGTSAANARTVIGAAPATGISLDTTTDSVSRLAMTPSERTKLSNLTGAVYITTVGAALPPDLADGTLIARYNPSGPATPVVTKVGYSILATSTTAISVTTTAVIPVGDVIAVAVNRGTGAVGQVMGSATVSVSSGAVDTWTRASANRVATHDTALIVARVTTAIPLGATVTVTTSTNNTNRAVAIVAGVHGVSSGVPSATSGDDAGGQSRDTDHGTTSGTATITAPTDGSTMVPHALVLGAFGIGPNATYTQAVGQTEIGKELTTEGSSDRGIAFAYKVVHATGVQSMTLNASANNGTTGVVVVLPIELIGV